MAKRDVSSNSRESTIDFLASAIAGHVTGVGDHLTTLPPLSLHRRDGPSEAIACIYGLGLAVTPKGRPRTCALNCEWRRTTTLIEP
jgi:hypothetical protein